MVKTQVVHRPREMRTELDQPPEPKPPQSRKDFGIAIVCALSLEADAVMEVFDHFWNGNIHGFGRAPGDDNSYTAGVIEGHNVVLVHMPGMGSIDAGAVASGLRASFPDLELALIVGICGGVPVGSYGKAIYLGDLIVSTAIVQYDYGRQTPGSFIVKNTLEESHGRPNNEIRGLLSKLQTQFYQRKLQNEMIKTMLDLQERMPEVRYPGAHTDQLRESTYLHKHKYPGTLCDVCNKSADEICQTAFDLSCHQLSCDPKQVVRTRDAAAVSFAHQLNDFPPTVHFGKLGSGNAVVKSGTHRDQIAQKHNLIGFEMEGVGLWDQFPCIIIKAVCDYADSHKNKDWQNYSTAVAAAGMKGILQQWSPRNKVDNIHTASEQKSEPQSNAHDNILGAQSVIFNNHGSVGRQVGTENIYGDQHNTMNFG